MLYGIGRLILDDAPLLKDNYAIVALINPRPVLVYQIGTHDTRVLVDISEEANVADAMTYMREVGKRLAIRLTLGKCSASLCICAPAPLLNRY
jgi:hypothetical protein